MAQEFWKYLPHVPQTNKKQINILKRKSEVTDKQVLNLTGGLFPVKLIDPNQHKNIPQKLDHWVYVPIIQTNRKVGPIYHWVKQDQAKKIYHGDKFNVDPQVISFTQQQYSQIINQHTQWCYSLVFQLFELLRRYNMNFIVVHDRFDNNQKNWSVEDLKQIYFSVTKSILMMRNQKQNILANYAFDKKYEINRKFELEKFFMRNKANNQQQRFLINEIRRLEILIKKQQREQINLKKTLKLDEVPDDPFELGTTAPQNTLQSLRKNQKVYSRQQYLCKALKLPGKINDKLTEVLHGMNIPDKIIATQQNQQLYDNLRKKILLMFSVQRYIRKKQNERRLLEEKKKKIALNQQDQDKRKNINIPDGMPKKKIHTSTK